MLVTLTIVALHLGAHKSDPVVQVYPYSSMAKCQQARRKVKAVLHRVVKKECAVISGPEPRGKA